MANVGVSRRVRSQLRSADHVKLSHRDVLARLREMLRVLPWICSLRSLETVEEYRSAVSGACPRRGNRNSTIW